MLDIPADMWYNSSMSTYSKAYYQEHKRAILAANKRWAIRNRAHVYAEDNRRGDITRAAVQWYKRSHPCVDCGNTNPVVLQFDHLPGRGTKQFTIGRNASRASLPKLWREMQKCDVVCANCHTVRTHDRRV